MRALIICITEAGPHSEAAGVDNYIGFPDKLFCLAEMDVAITARAVDYAFGLKGLCQVAAYKPFCTHYDDKRFCWHKSYLSAF